MTPLARLYILLGGGWTTAGALAGGLVLLVAAAATIMYRLSSDPADVTAWLVTLLAVGQGILLLLVAPNAISSAVRRDYETGAIDSHRLTPLSNLQLVLGYMLGPPFLAFAPYFAILLVSNFFVGHYGSLQGLGVGNTLLSWYLAQALVLVPAAVLGALVLAVAINFNGRANAAIPIVVGLLLGGWVVVTLVPGLGLLLGFAAVQRMIVGITRGVTAFNGAEVLASLPFQVALLFILLLAASRRIRRPELPLFSVPLGAAMMIIVMVALLAGLTGWTQTWGPADPPFAITLTASATVLLLFAQIVLASAAVDSARAHHAALFGEPTPSGARLRMLTIPVLTIALLMALMVGALRHAEWQGSLALSSTTLGWSLGAIACAVVFTIVTDMSWFAIAATRGKPILWAFIWSTLLLKAGPLLIDAVVYSLQQRYGAAPEFVDLPASGASMIGTCVLSVLPDGRPWPGLLVQFAIAIAMLSLAVYVRRRSTATAVVSSSPPAASPS